MQRPSVTGLEFHRARPSAAHGGQGGRSGLRTEEGAATPRATGRGATDRLGPGGRLAAPLGLGALALLGLALSAGCGISAQQGDCGPYLSSAECQVVRVQLGTLDPLPPPDPTNRFGRCVREGSAECIVEEAAAELGRRLFFDTCMSAYNNVACVTCHQPAQAFTDDRARLIGGADIDVVTAQGPQKVVTPYIENPTAERITTAPPLVKPLLDLTGTPLARWNADRGLWEPVARRPLSSIGSNKTGAAISTARHSPTLYNLGYGSGVMPLHGERTYGATWTPWDGRYDSAWALVADVWEFGGTHGTDRSHIAVRIGQKHRAAYEKMIGGPLFDFDAKQLDSDGIMKPVYPRHGSPGGTGVSACWYQADSCKNPKSLSLFPTDVVRANVNEVFVNAGKALGAYMRRLRSRSSPYDRWLAGDAQAMSAAAQRGLRLFIGKAECIMCHSGPNFTDWRFHNLGVPIDDPERRLAGSLPPQNPDDLQKCFDGFGPAPICPDPGRQGWQLRAAGQCAKDTDTIDSKTFTCQRVDQPPSRNRYDIAMDCRSSASDATDKDQQCLPATVADVTKCAFGDATSCAGDPLCEWSGGLGRCIARALPAELGQFKTPSLRNVGLTFPYMHNGMLFDYGPGERGETAVDDPTPHLTRVVEFYDQGGGQPDVGKVDPLIHPLHLGKPEIADLVEFLKALTDNSLTTASDPLTLPPTDLLDVSDCPDPLP